MSTDDQDTKCRRNIAENLNRLSRAHERYRRQTDGRATANSEFTFAKSWGRPICEFCVNCSYIQFTFQAYVFFLSMKIAHSIYVPCVRCSMLRAAALLLLLAAYFTERCWLMLRDALDGLCPSISWTDENFPLNVFHERLAVNVLHSAENDSLMTASKRVFSLIKLTRNTFAM